MTTAFVLRAQPRIHIIFASSRPTTREPKASTLVSYAAAKVARNKVRYKRPREFRKLVRRYRNTDASATNQNPATASPPATASAT